jgi:hypothetical protein
MGRTESDDAGTKAAHALQQSTYLEQRPAFDRLDRMAKIREAQHAREEGEPLFHPATAQEGAGMIRAAGEALLHTTGQVTGLSRERLGLEVYLLDTLDTPNMIVWVRPNCAWRRQPLPAFLSPLSMRRRRRKRTIRSRRCRRTNWRPVISPR